MTATFISFLKSRGFAQLDGGIAYTRTTPRSRRSGCVFAAWDGQIRLILQKGGDTFPACGTEKEMAKIIRRLFSPPKGG